MPTLIAFHEVDDGAHWANAWKKGTPGNRHDMFAKIGVKARNFRDPKNPHMAGVLLEVPDLAKFDAFMASPEAQQAMREDRLKVSTLRVLVEFEP